MGKKSPVIGVYRGNIVVIRSVNKRSVDLNRNILKELTTVSIKVFGEVNVMICIYISVSISDERPQA